MTSKVVSKCVVELVVECDSTWSTDTTIEQIVKQSTDDAKHRISKLFADASFDEKELASKRKGQNGVFFGGVKKADTQVITEK